MSDREFATWFPCNAEDKGDRIKAKSPDARRLFQEAGVSSWQKLAALHDPRYAQPWLDDVECWGATLPAGLVDVDFDIHDGADGFAEAQRLTGARYGSPEFPRTLAVRTPSGGLHLTYRIPRGVDLKNGCNGFLSDADREAKRPFPMDLRVGQRGFCVMPGSRIRTRRPDGTLEEGDYVAVDRPAGDTIPLLPDCIGTLCVQLNFVANCPRPVRTTAGDILRDLGDRPPRPTGRIGGGERPWKVKATFAPHARHSDILSQAWAITTAWRDGDHSDEWLEDALQRLIDAVPAEHAQREPWDAPACIDGALNANAPGASVSLNYPY